MDKFIPDPFQEADDEGEGETGEDEEDGSEEDIDDEIEADEPPSKKLKPTEPTSYDLASKANAPEISSTRNPDAGAP